MGLFKKEKITNVDNQNDKKKRVIKYKTLIMTILVLLVLLIVSSQSKVVNETINTFRKRICFSITN